MTAEEFAERYTALAHAIQTSAAHELAADTSPSTPKHLRTGLDIVMTDHASLARLRVDKGLLSLSEYQEALLRGLEEEKDRCEARLSRRLGARITLA